MKKKLSTICALALLTGIIPAFSSQPARAAQTSYLNVMDFGNGNWIYNFDFADQSAVSSSNVDWEMNMLWFNQADVYKVKNQLAGTWNFLLPGFSSLPQPFSDKYAFFWSQYASQWDGDKGAKWEVGGFCNTEHVRVYAPSGTDRFDFSTNGGYVVIGSTHRDHNDPGICTGSKFYNDSEYIESNLVWRYQNQSPTWSTWQNYFYTGPGQYGNDALEGSTHVWYTNGGLSEVMVP